MEAPVRNPAVAAAALACFAGSLVLFGAASPGFEHMRHPVALLGATGEPNALAFNLLGFATPGLLLAWQAWRWRSASAQAGWRLRLGLQLVLLSALAFAAQGLLPLDPANLLAPASRLHATAWTTWWIAFAPGGLLVASGLGRGGVPALLLLLAMLVAVLVVAAGSLLPAALAQRFAFAGWFAWWIVAAFRMGRRP